MDKCWANSFGECGDKLTREHLISNSILKKKIVVQGFNWCKDEPKEIGSAGLVSKFLCNHHNSSLSDCDSEIAKFVDTMDNFIRTEKKFSKYGFSNKKIPIQYNINGSLVEKWFVKTLINVTLINEKEVIFHFDKILSELYTEKQFEYPFGFSFAVKTGQKIQIKDEIQIIPLFNQTNNNKELAGGIFVFRGFIIIILVPCSKFPIQDNRLSLSIENKNFNDLQLNWHNKEIIQDMRKGRKMFKVQSIKFDW